MTVHIAISGRMRIAIVLVIAPAGYRSAKTSRFATGFTSPASAPYLIGYRMFQRDPLSVRYDPTAAQVMIRAIRASRNGTGVQVWIASTRAELRNPDAGGRTAHERAFTRAAYYLVWRAPLNAGRIPDWSLKVTWGDELRPSSGGRMARPARLRIFPRRGPRGGRQHAYALPESRQWARNEGLRSGGIGSGRERF